LLFVIYLIKDKIANFLTELYYIKFYIMLITNFILNNAFNLIDIIERKEIKQDYSNLV